MLQKLSIFFWGPFFVGRDGLLVCFFVFWEGFGVFGFILSWRFSLVARGAAAALRQLRRML